MTKADSYHIHYTILYYLSIAPLPRCACVADCQVFGHGRSQQDTWSSRLYRSSEACTGSRWPDERLCTLACRLAAALESSPWRNTQAHDFTCAATTATLSWRRARHIHARHFRRAWWDRRARLDGCSCCSALWRRLQSRTWLTDCLGLSPHAASAIHARLQRIPRPRPHPPEPSHVRIHPYTHIHTHTQTTSCLHPTPTRRPAWPGRPARPPTPRRSPPPPSVPSRLRTQASPADGG